MRTLSLVAVLTASVTATNSQNSAVADWSIYRQSGGSTVFAYVELSSGLGIAFRCVSGNFAAVVSGLPPAARDQKTRKLNLRIREDEAYDSGWTVGSDPTVALADFPASLARELREGGSFSLMVPGGGQNGANLRYNMTLPVSANAIDEVLTTCDRPLVDPRDELLVEADAAQLPDGMTWARPPRPRFPASLYAEGYAAVSCVVQPDARLSSCQVESEFPADGGFGRATLLAMRDARVISPNETPGSYAPRIVGFRTDFRMR